VSFTHVVTSEELPIVPLSQGVVLPNTALNRFFPRATGGDAVHLA
jgi:hypothetical protein